MKEIYVVMNVTADGSPTIIQIHYDEDSAANQVAALKYLDFTNVEYEKVWIETDK